MLKLNIATLNTIFGNKIAFQQSRLTEIIPFAIEKKKNLFGIREKIILFLFLYMYNADRKSKGNSCIREKYLFERED